jgi:single-strand DNA-binding protein
MNSCILMAQIVSDPELRSTQDQVSVASMMVEFESTREGDAPGKVQVEGWGNLAEEIKNTYSAGEQIIIEGRLSMNLFEMPEGYKEKRAKLVASKIYPVGGSISNSDRAMKTNDSSNVVEFAANSPSQPEPAYSDTTVSTSESAVPTNTGNEDWDEIPF